MPTRTLTLPLLFGAGCVLLGVVGVACGSAPGEELFGSGSGASGGAGGSTTTTSSTTSSGTTSSGTTSSCSSSSSSSSSTSSSSSSSSSSSGGTGAVVFCKGAPCDAGQVCCFHSNNPDMDHCGAPASCGGGYIELSCNGPEDCNGGVCCGDYDFQQQHYNGVSCQPVCQGVTLCTGNPAVCTVGQCQQSQTLGSGYQVCVN